MIVVCETCGHAPKPIGAYQFSGGCDFCYLTREVQRLRSELMDISRQLACQCDPCWTDRGLHAPECQWDVAEQAAEAAKEGKQE
jgi:hypothetical protein